MSEWVWLNDLRQTLLYLLIQSTFLNSNMLQKYIDVIFLRSQWGDERSREDNLLERARWISTHQMGGKASILDIFYFK